MKYIKPHVISFMIISSFFSQEKQPLLEEGEVIKRLRERGQPIKLFGETVSETYLRLRHLEMQEPSGSKSQTDFKSAMEKIDQVTYDFNDSSISIFSKAVFNCLPDIIPYCDKTYTLECTETCLNFCP